MILEFMSFVFMASINTQIRSTLAASGFSFLLSILLTPVISRLYGPSEYGVFAAVNGFATVMAAACLLSLPNALAVSQSGLRRRQLAAILFKLTVFGTLITAILTALLLSYAPDGRFPWWIIIAVPLLMITNSVNRIANSASISHGLFGSQVRGRLAYAFLTRPLTAALGSLFPAKAWLMATCEAVAYAAQAGLLLKDLPIWRADLATLRTQARTPIVSMIRRYSLFTGYDYLTQMLVLASSILPSVIVAWRFGPAPAGILALALSVLSLPIQLIALAIAPALLYRIKTWVQVGDRQTANYLRWTACCLAGMALGGYGLLGVISPWLLPIFLGPMWAKSGQLAVWFAFAFGIQFFLTPFEASYWFSGHTRAKLQIYAVGSAGALVVLASPLTDGATAAIRGFALIISLQRSAELLLLARSTFVLRQRRKSSSNASPPV